jgi:hypothetical protein
VRDFEREVRFELRDRRVFLHGICEQAPVRSRAQIEQTLGDLARVLELTLGFGFELGRELEKARVASDGSSEQVLVRSGELCAHDLDEGSDDFGASLHGEAIMPQLRERDSEIVARSTIWSSTKSNGRTDISSESKIANVSAGSATSNPGLRRAEGETPQRPARGGTELEFVIMVIAVSCVKLLSAHNSTQHTSRKHKV